jgi:hypothetical protein
MHATWFIQLILPDLITIKIFDEVYKSWSSSLSSPFQHYLTYTCVNIPMKYELLPSLPNVQFHANAFQHCITCSYCSLCSFYNHTIMINIYFYTWKTQHKLW